MRAIDELPHLLFSANDSSLCKVSFGFCLCKLRPNHIPNVNNGKFYHRQNSQVRRALNLLAVKGAKFDDLDLDSNLARVVKFNSVQI